MSVSRADQSKADLRAAALAARDALSEEHRAAAAQAIAERGLPIEIAPGSVVAGYSPIRSEIDPVPLMQKLAALGAQLALPVITARGQSLHFRVWHPGDRLMRGTLGILEPSPAAAEIIPDIVLVPLAAFDRAGHRIGYGAGLCANGNTTARFPEFMICAFFSSGTSSAGPDAPPSRNICPA